MVKTAVIDEQMTRIDSARVRMMDTGHACFWDDADGYNDSLREFAAQL